MMFLLIALSVERCKYFVTLHIKIDNEIKIQIQIQNWLYVSDFISECVWSFGEDCQYPCHRHCLNQTCDRFNGSCLYGFSDEYMYCELGKIKSYNTNKSDINSTAQ